MKDAPDLRGLRALLERGSGRDRAFVDAITRMRWSRDTLPEKRAELLELHDAVRAAALESHAAVRADIASGKLRGRDLRLLFEEVPAPERDHFVEEVLGVAYPPLDELALGPELIGYTPSGYDEIVHALDVTELGPSDVLLDLGSGAGKVVMLATLLTGATSVGVERDPALVALATEASRALALDAALHRQGDAREIADAGADVVFLYLPFTGSALASVMARLVEDARRSGPGRTPRFVCCGPLDLDRYPDLALAGPPRSWLNVYAFSSGGISSVTPRSSTPETT